MVHEYTRAQIWYHDILNIFALISDGHPLVKNIQYLDDARMRNRIETVHMQGKKLKSCIDELLIIDGQRKNSSLISDDEYKQSIIWHKNTIIKIANIISDYRYMSNYKSMSDCEYDLLYNKIGESIKPLRKLILERYEFEIEIDRRNGICTPSIKKI
jgi:hypothetical protein